MVNMCTIFDQITGTVCPLCQQPGRGFCFPCRQSLPYNRHSCARCALPLPELSPAGVWCADCQARTPAFDRVLAPLLYQDPVDQLVADFKYHRRLDSGRLLAEICAEFVREDAARVQLLLPVPMHAAQLRERGFNQAAELARHLSRQVGVEWATDRLVKATGSRHQQTLKRRQRRRNVRGIFACKGSLPAAVALVDDVMTTGATADEASRVLKRAGAAHVEVWTLARTARDRRESGS